MTYQNILFDVDGTLLDTLSAAVMAAKDTLLALTGKQYSTDELRFAFGLPISQSAKMLGISNVREFEECYAQNYKNTAQEHIRVFPGVYELLKALRERNLLLGVITSKARWEYEHLFDKFRLKEYFSCTI
ncbi:MAG: HAD family hydrolase, partial [Christensenellaceae bacterium]